MGIILVHIKNVNLPEKFANKLKIDQTQITGEGREMGGAEVQIHIGLH